MDEINKSKQLLNMEIKEHIKKAMELKDNPEIDFTTIQQKIQDVSKVLNHLNALKDDIEKECWKIWLNRLNQKYPNYKIIEYPTERKFPRVGISMTYKGVEFAIMIEKENKIYYGVSRPNFDVKKDETIKPFLTQTISEIGGFSETDNWYGWQYTSFQNGFERLIALITLVEEKIKANSI